MSTAPDSQFGWGKVNAALAGCRYLRLGSCVVASVALRFSLCHARMQGILAPFIASISLFGLYLLIKYLPDLSLQTVLDVYFFLVGSLAISSGASVLLKVRPLLALLLIVDDAILVMWHA